MPLSAPSFARVLGRADLVLFSVSAILTIDTLASAASMGLTWFGWWGITMAVFFVPYGLITAELGAAWPGEGGLFVWVREALGPRWGSLAAWFYWINNAYWVPSVLPAPGKPLEFAYEISWQGDKLQQPPGSWVTQTRRGTGWLPPGTSAPPNQVQYVVDFAGPALEALPEDTAVRAVVSSDANGRLLEELAYRNPATKGWRMTVRVARQDATRPVELRAFLQHDKDILSETWTNIILPE